MLRSEPRALAGQLAQPFGMDALGNGGLEAHLAQAGELFDDARQRAVAWRPGRLARPGQHTGGRALLVVKQDIQGVHLRRGQGLGELVGDVPLGHDQHRGDKPLQDGRAGDDDPAPAQLVHQRRGDGGGTRCGERDGQQPSEHVPAVSGSEHAEAELLAQSVKLLPPGLGPGGVGGQGGWVHMQLVGNEAQGGVGNGLAGPQQPAGIPEGAKLQGVAELVGGAAAPVHRG